MDTYVLLIINLNKNKYKTQECNKFISKYDKITIL